MHKPIASSISELLERIDDEPDREGLLNTPARVEKMWNEFYEKGKKEFKFTTFENKGIDEMITQECEFYSVCEHHLLPFFGTAYIAYIPNHKLVGISKLARTVDFFASRLQMQERLTSQVAKFINKGLDPKGVGVHMRGKHLCMSMRGVAKQTSWSTTTVLLGAFKKPEVKTEFLRGCK